MLDIEEDHALQERQHRPGRDLWSRRHGVVLAEGRKERRHPIRPAVAMGLVYVEGKRYGLQSLWLLGCWMLGWGSAWILRDTDSAARKMRDTCGNLSLDHSMVGPAGTGQVMRQMYERHFHSEMPNLKELVVDQIKPRLERLAKKNMPGLCPLIGLAHGDLNAANIMIDALDTSRGRDAVWLIDFATSVDLPLLTDLCKFEMACLFEYAILPITAENLVDLSGPDEAHWERMGIGEWLGVQQDVATTFLKLLQQKIKREKLASMEPSQLESLVDEAIQQLPTHKQPQVELQMGIGLM
eukprot:s1401_g7.t1